MSAGIVSLLRTGHRYNPFLFLFFHFFPTFPLDPWGLGGELNKQKEETEEIHGGLRWGKDENRCKGSDAETHPGDSYWLEWVHVVDPPHGTSLLALRAVPIQKHWMRGRKTRAIVPTPYRVLRPLPEP